MPSSITTARVFPYHLEPGDPTRAEVCGCVSTVLESLKPEYRDALRIVDLEDAPLSHLAAHAGITAENAAVRIHRARKALRGRVEQACGTCATHGCFHCTCEPPK